MTAHGRRRRPNGSTPALVKAIPVEGSPASLELDTDEDAGPTEGELLAIEADWPVFAAYLAVVDAECRFAASPDVLARRALRRAEVALAKTLATHANTNPVAHPSDEGVPQ